MDSNVKADILKKTETLRSRLIDQGCRKLREVTDEYQSNGGIVLKRENRRLSEEICSNVTCFTTNFTWNERRMKGRLGVEKLPPPPSCGIWSCWYNAFKLLLPPWCRELCYWRKVYFHFGYLQAMIPMASLLNFVIVLWLCFSNSPRAFWVTSDLSNSFFCKCISLSNDISLCSRCIASIFSAVSVYTYLSKFKPF